MTEQGTGGRRILGALGRLRGRAVAVAVDLAERSRRFPPPRWRGRLVLVGAVVFVVGAVVAARRLEIDWSTLGWGWLALAVLVGVPTTVTANALEYRLSARLLGHDVGFLAATRVAVLATAANLLPVPGGVLVRMQALRSSGRSYADAGRSTAAVGLAWLGVSATIAGALLATLGDEVGPAAVLVALGVLGMLASGGLVAGLLPAGSRGRFVAAVLAVESLAMLAGVFRLYVVLLAIGEDPTVAGAGLLSLAGVAAAAAGVFPGGLGLRELLATVLGPVGGVSGAAAFLSTAVDRVLGLAFHGPLALVVARTSPDADAVGESVED